MKEFVSKNAPATTVSLYECYRNFNLVVDSRRVDRPRNTLFFALPGQRTNGHQFVGELLKKGVRNFVVARDSYPGYREAYEEILLNLESTGEDVNGTFVIVEKPGATLRRLAAHHRRQFSIPIVAITGSNGKTIVKDWLAQVLSTRYRVCSSPRSYNSLVGVPLSVWQLNPDHGIGVFEAGISHPGDMAELQEIIQPTYGILTNIGTAHTANFASTEQHLAQKMLLFSGTEWTLLPAVEKDAYAYLTTKNVTVQPHAWKISEAGDLQLGRHTLDFTFPALPAVYLSNARTVAAAAYLLGVEERLIRHQLPQLKTLSNRLERRLARDGGILINDSYSNDISALAAALTFAETQDHFGRITLILGTLQDVPDKFSGLSRLLSGRVDCLLLVGTDNRAARDVFPRAEYYDSTEALLAQLPDRYFYSQTVIVKGASYEGFDRIADALSARQHRTLLTLDLGKVRHNFLTYRARLPKKCQLVAMTKASAYGSGAIPVAKNLAAAGADYLAVAYPEEGKELRRAGISLPIIVLNAERYSFGIFSEFNLEPVIHDREGLLAAAALKLAVHLEIDTGMGRLGFSAADFRRLCVEKPGAKVISIITHLAASEDPGEDTFTHRQVATFNDLLTVWLGHGNPPVKRSILNSNGISRFPAYAYEMVRLGIGLYGIGDAALQASLQPALTLTTRVAALNDRVEGETVGYGRRGIISGKKRIAVLSIGYADGLPRAAGEGRFSVGIGKDYAPTVGSICMDMCMVDVTGVPGVTVGTEVTIFGPDHPIDHLATAARTIPYEILTGIGTRVNRIYLEG